MRVSRATIFSGIEFQNPAIHWMIFFYPFPLSFLCQFITTSSQWYHGIRPLFLQFKYVSGFFILTIWIIGVIFGWIGMQHNSNFQDFYGN